MEKALFGGTLDGANGLLASCASGDADGEDVDTAQVFSKIMEAAAQESREPAAASYSAAEAFENALQAPPPRTRIQNHPIETFRGGFGGLSAGSVHPEGNTYRFYHHTQHRP